MKKSLLALAVLGAFAGAASAQSSVTLYGRVDLGIQNSNKSQFTQSGGLNSSLLSGAHESADAQMVEGGASRLGFRGVEDLGNGLKANFNLEHRFTADTGVQSGGRQWTQSWVGLSSDSFGEVRLGRDYTPARDVAVAADPFGFETVGRAGSLHSLLGLSPERFDNAISYKTPNFAGFTAKGAFSLKEENNQVPGNKENAFGVSLNYNNGPLAIAAAYEDAGTQTPAGLTGAAGAAETKLGLVTAAYDFGVVRPMLLVSKGTADNAAGVEIADRTTVQLGLTAPLAGGEVKAVALRTKIEDGGADDKITKFGLGYHYFLSKRTKLYTDVGTAKQDDLRRRTAFDVGVSHTF